MRTIHSLFPDRDSLLKKEKDPEKMDFLMRSMKAVRSFTNPTSVTSEDLNKQRTEMELFSRLVTPQIGIHIESFSIGKIACEWIRPDFAHRKDKFILYCHGGGYTCGGLSYARILATKLALHTGLETVSFEYRLAPEHPYPAQIDDAMKVWNYLMSKGYGAKDIILAGDSAGGNLALELILKLNSEERLLPKALVLFSPWTDMRATNSSYEAMKDKDPSLTKEYVTAVRGAYAGEDADFSNPLFSPLLADFSDCPPALIQVGSNEILRDDSEKLAKKLSKAGFLAKLEVTSGGWHVFQQMPIHKAANALDNVKLFLDNIL